MLFCVCLFSANIIPLYVNVIRSLIQVCFEGKNWPEGYSMVLHRGGCSVGKVRNVAEGGRKEALYSGLRTGRKFLKGNENHREGTPGYTGPTTM